MDAYDPNVPDCSNGDYFCKLCLSSMNSESMWSSHIVGRRHIKNVQKFPNGIPSGKRFLDDGDDDSSDMPAKYHRYDNEYDWGNDYPPPRYQKDLPYVEDYHHGRPLVNYEPVVKPNVVIDYGHTKKLEVPPLSKPEEVSLPKPSKSDVVPPDVDVDEVLINILKSKNPQPKDDFFEKINQREIAKDIAKELAKKCFFSEKPEKDTQKESRSKSSSKSPSDNSEKFRKKKSADIFDFLHKKNDEKLFKISDEEEPIKKSSSKTTSKKSKSILDNLDPDELTPDLVDDLLSAQLKKKKDIKSVKTKLYAEKSTNVDNIEILETLPTMAFLELVQKKLKILELRNSDEFKMLLKVYFEVQAIVDKKLPSDLKALVKGLSSGTSIMQTVKPVHNSVISQSQPVASASSSVMNPSIIGNSTITSTPRLPLNSYVSVNSARQNANKPTPLPVQNCVESQSPSSLVNNVRIAQINSLLSVPPPPPPPVPVVPTYSVATSNIPSSSVSFPPSKHSSFSQPTKTSVSGTNMNRNNSQVSEILQSLHKNNQLSSAILNFMPNSLKQSKVISSQQPVQQLKQQTTIANSKPQFSKDVVDALQKLQTLSDEYRKTNQPTNISSLQNPASKSNPDRTFVADSVSKVQQFKTNPSQQSVHQSRQQLSTSSNSDTYFSKKMIEELLLQTMSDDHESGTVSSSKK